MKFLLDTHIWIWYLLEHPSLPISIREKMDEQGSELWISPITVWETLLLGEKKKIKMDDNPASWVQRALEKLPVFEAPLTTKVAIKSRSIKLPHHDPADRFLAATAFIYDLTLITCDSHLRLCSEIKTLKV